MIIRQDRFLTNPPTRSIQIICQQNYKLLNLVFISMPEIGKFRYIYKYWKNTYENIRIS